MIPCPRPHRCCAALLLCILPLAARGQSRPATRSATDLSSPRAALLTIYTAMRAGDVQTIQSALLFDQPDAAEVFQISLAQLCAPLRLMHAMERRFGPAGGTPFDPSVEKSIEEAIAQIKRVDITITGDTAVVAEKKAAVNPDAETEFTGVTLKRVAAGTRGAESPGVDGEQWKVLASTFPESDGEGEVSPKQLALMRSLRDAQVKACDTTIARLQRGDFRSPDEAYAAYQSLLQPSAKAAARK